VGVWRAGLVGALTAGCVARAATPAPRQVQPATARVQVFTEPSSIDELRLVDDVLAVRRDDRLSLWHPTGGRLPLPAALADARVLAIARDGGATMLALTDDALLRFDVRSARLEPLPAPPRTANARPRARLASDRDGGVWIALDRDVYARTASGWHHHRVEHDVTTLTAAPAGGATIGTQRGLWHLDAALTMRRIGPDEGNPIVAVRHAVPLDDPHVPMVVVGSDAAGRQRLVLGDGATFRALQLVPNVPWDDAVPAGAGVLVRSGQQLYRFGGAAGRGIGAAARGGAKAVTADVHDGKLALWPLGNPLPPDTTALAAGDGGDVWAGTAARGVAHVPPMASEPQGWLRDGEVVASATDLSIACVAEDACWLSTGAALWRWTGTRFEPDPLAPQALAVVQPAPDRVVVIARDPATAALALSERGAGEATWGPLRVPANAGRLWLGVDAAGDVEPTTRIEPPGAPTFVLDLAAPGAPAAQALPQADVRAIAFGPGGDAWCWSPDALGRLRGERLERWPSADASLPVTSPTAWDAPRPSVRGLAVVAGLGVALATSAGLDVWDGRAWRRPPAFGYEIRDLVTSAAGTLWLATDRGVAVFEGDRVRRIDRRRGLLEDRVLDLAIDRFDRVWARTASAVVLITP
jgi:hypothetical protein